jgi:glutathione S-transferase
VLKDQKYLSGEAPAYPDYILLGSFLWPRTLSPLELLEKDDAVYAWRERMLDLFDGFARNAPAAG